MMTTNMECEVSTPYQKIYDKAKSCIGQDISLDQTIPNDVQCAEAVSYILKACQYDIPRKGIAGTGTLYAWLHNNPLFKETRDFNQMEIPKYGSIIISPAGTSKIGYPHGHTGIVAKYGVLSNDSDTGLFLEKYTLKTWMQFFGEVRGLETYFFEPL